jgi:hypothetical protein
MMSTCISSLGTIGIKLPKNISLMGRKRLEKTMKNDASTMEKGI